MELIGGYQTPYSPWSALELLNTNSEQATDDLWENLYHQGDVGTASYAAVPLLVEYGLLSLVAAIEVARHEEHNPELPEQLSLAYHQALSVALSSTPGNEEQYQGYYVIHASVNGQTLLAKAMHLMCIEEVIAEYG